MADPGSIHKAFTIGAALQEGLITPDSVQVVGPALERGGYTLPGQPHAAARAPR